MWSWGGKCSISGRTIIGNVKNKPKVNVLANKKYRCVNNTGVEKYVSAI